MSFPELEKILGSSLFDYQIEAIHDLQSQVDRQPRQCLYFRTGAGKTLTAIMSLKAIGVTEALVIAPPITHPAWIEQGQAFGLDVVLVSHAKFRMPGFRVSRTVAVIADEVHLFGGHLGKGWRKLDRLAAGLQAPLIVMSATPNYNDAERVYCIQHLLDPGALKGGYIQFLYTHCVTRENPFRTTPDVEGFLHFPDAVEYLRALPHVLYVPSIHSAQINNIMVNAHLPREADEYGLHRRKERIFASQIEKRYAERHDTRVGADGFLTQSMTQALRAILKPGNKPVLLFCASSTIARAAEKTLFREGLSVACLTGQTSKESKERVAQKFRVGGYDVLIGTATLATGTDGFDKICDTLLILDDTDDKALRDQLIGRILPRGLNSDASRKTVHRILTY